LPEGMGPLVDLLTGLMGEMKMCRKEMGELVEKMYEMKEYMKEMKLPEENPQQMSPPMEPAKAGPEVVAKKVNEEVKRRIAAMLGKLG